MHEESADPTVRIKGRPIPAGMAAVPKICALSEATYSVGLRKAGMPEKWLRSATDWARLRMTCTNVIVAST